MTDKETYDLVIVGTGPGGYVAAVRAAQLGLKVACVEKQARLGGVCLNIGCIPSKVLLDSSEYYHLARDQFKTHGIKTGTVGLDLDAMMARKDKVVEDLTENVRKLLERNKIQIIHGTARLAGADRVEIELAGGGKKALSAKAILLATGSESISVPGLEFDGESIVSSSKALAFPEVPKTIGIVGGGYIGLELGSVWMRLGSKVTVIEMLPSIAVNLDGQVGRTLKRLLAGQGMEIRVKAEVKVARVTGKKRKKVKVKIEQNGKTEEVAFDRLLVAVGRRPMTRDLGLKDLGIQTDPQTGHVLVDERFQTSVGGIYAIGDLTPGPMLAHKASAEGIAAAECIAGMEGEINYDTIPGVIYTWPEVAGVGLTQEQVKERGIPHCVGTYPFAGNGRARCLGETDGFAKVIAHEKTDRILGIHIIGPRAADMIAECILAMELGAGSEDIARTIHAHPTFSETLQEAAMACSAVRAMRLKKSAK